MRDVDSPPVSTAMVRALALCTGPALCMLVGGLATTVVKFDSTFMCAMQHLGGGVVIAAVAIEIMPKLVHASEGWDITAAIIAGFVFGVLAMLILKAMSGEEDEGNSDAGEAQPLRPTTSVGLTRRSSLGALVTNPRKSVVRIATARGQDNWTQTYPWTMFIAVAIDSLMDGLLVGIAMIAGEKAGLMMAFALAIEMMFLGTVFAASLTKFSYPIRLASCVFMPAMIMLGGCLGAAGAGMLAANEGLFVMILAFGAAAMLYLVAEELLLEAHEEGGVGHVWWIDLCFFVGVLLVLVMERAT